ncbi:MAG: DMT family transporter [Firmicutes bacterium]|nr:DMT family transporter [Dethiobacter sp.]MBS3889565.1 DMT family transporter [Bacillota bacterium]
MTPKLGYAAIAVSSLCFGFLGSLGKFGFALGYTPLTLLTVRFTLAALMMWAVALVVGLGKYAVTPQLQPYLIAQGVAYAGTSLGFFLALRHLPAGLVSIVFYVHPLVTIIFASLLWKERLGRSVLIAALLAVLGTALVSQDGSTNFSTGMVGFAWVAFAAFAYSAFTLLGQKSTRQLNALVVTTYSITYCALFLIVLNPPLYMFDGSLTAAMWLIGLFIGLVSSVLAILLYIVGVKAIGAAKASIASALEPLSGVFIAALLLGEELRPLQWLGVLTVIVAVFYLQRGALDDPRHREVAPTNRA